MDRPNYNVGDVLKIIRDTPGAPGTNYVTVISHTKTGIPVVAPLRQNDEGDPITVVMTYPKNMHWAKTKNRWQVYGYPVALYNK